MIVEFLLVALIVVVAYAIRRKRLSVALRAEHALFIAAMLCGSAAALAMFIPGRPE